MSRLFILLPIEKMSRRRDGVDVDVWCHTGPGVVQWADGRSGIVPSTSLSATTSFRRQRGGVVAARCRPGTAGPRLAGRSVYRARQRRLRLPARPRRRRSRHRVATGARVTSPVTWLDPDIVTAGELQAVVMACLYVAFCYVGCEISYPLKVRRHFFLQTYWGIFLHSPPPSTRTQHFWFIPAQNSHPSPSPNLPYYIHCAFIIYAFTKQKYQTNPKFQSSVHRHVLFAFYRVWQNKVASLFSQQPLGISIWYFTELFLEIFYI